LHPFFRVRRSGKKYPGSGSDMTQPSNQRSGVFHQCTNEGLTDEPIGGSEKLKLRSKLAPLEGDKQDSLGILSLSRSLSSKKTREPR
jgi:hypothetical protein